MMSVKNYTSSMAKKISVQNAAQVPCKNTDTLRLNALICLAGIIVKFSDICEHSPKFFFQKNLGALYIVFTIR